MVTAEAEADETLTASATRRRTKIVATIGPVSRDAPVLERLVEAGMDVARINLSHGDPAEHAHSWPSSSTCPALSSVSGTCRSRLQ